MNRTTLAAVFAAACVVALTSCASDQADIEASPTPSRAPLFSALLECGLIRGAEGVRLGDDDTSLALSTKGNVDYGATPESAECVLGELGAPDSTWELVSGTRAIDGRQSDDWGGYEASWTYHPDDGLQMIITTES